MDLAFSPEERAFRDEVRAFIATHLPQDIRRKVQAGDPLEKDDYARWQRILFEKGWVAPNWPKEYGGPGWSAVQKHIWREEIAYGWAPRLLPFGLQMVAPVIMEFGNDEQRAHYLPRILSGQDFWCQGYSEPGAGSDLAALEHARRAARRRLPDQRHQDLDHRRAVGRLDLRAGAHRPERQETGRHLVHPGRHAHAGHLGAPDPDHRRRGRDQRGAPRERRGAAAQPGRRRGRRLDLRQVLARARAHRYGRDRRLPPDAGTGVRADGARVGRPTRASTTVSPRSRSSSKRWPSPSCARWPPSRPASARGPSPRSSRSRAPSCSSASPSWRWTRSGRTPSRTWRTSTSTCAKPRSTPVRTRSRRTSSPSASSSYSGFAFREAFAFGLRPSRRVRKRSTWTSRFLPSSS